MKPKDLEASIQDMLNGQHALNCEVHPEWWTQGYNYSRAVWVELAELEDHYGWKWWTKQEPNLIQCRLEIVDAWHFVLSGLLRDHLLRDGRADDGEIASDMAQAITPVVFMEVRGDERRDFLSSVDALAVDYAALASTNRSPSHVFFGRLMRDFVRMMYALPMTWDDLRFLYLGKNVLNFYRQQNGYKSGTYPKVYPDGREDNEHLAEIVGDIVMFSDDLLQGGDRFQKEVWDCLERRRLAAGSSS